MLPKPQFNRNPVTTQLNNGLQLAQNWFECSAHESQHKLVNYQSSNNNNQNNVNSLEWHQNNQLSSHINYSKNGQNFNNNGFNNRNDGQNWQKSYQYKRVNNYNHQNNNNKMAFNCDSCCRSFPNEEIYKTHLSEHIMCSLDGCTFTAHPKVITSHQRMQHFCFRDKSLVKKFMSLDTPEDIAKWREERKANFPTKLNIDKKKEKTIQLSNDGFNQKSGNQFSRNSNVGRNEKFNRFDRKNNFKRKQFNRNFERRETPDVFSESVKPSNSESISSDIKKPKLDSKPTNDDVEEGEIFDSDIESNVKQNKPNVNKNETKIVTNNKSGALNLLAAYDSDEESETDSDRKVQNPSPIKDLTSVHSPQKLNRLIHEDINITNDTNVNETAAVITSEIRRNNKPKRGSKKGSFQRRPPTNDRNRKLTLFQKLLMNDIQSKEQQIMECIKLIVDNNFLQK